MALRINNIKSKIDQSTKYLPLEDNHLAYTANRKGTFFIDNTHDDISINFKKTGTHDDEVVKNTKTGTTSSVCNEFKNFEGCTEHTCDNLPYLNNNICFIKDAFILGAALKGINNYIDSAGTPDIKKFFLKYGLSNDNTTSLVNKNNELEWSIYTNYDALMYMYIKYVIKGSTNVNFLNHLNQNFNRDNEKYISVINSNFLWQADLYYCYKTIETSIIDMVGPGLIDAKPFTADINILKHAINILRQIQFVDIDDEINSSSGLLWELGFDNSDPGFNIDTIDTSEVNMKKVNSLIFAEFSNIFEISIVPSSLPYKLDNDNAYKYNFVGTQPLMAKIITNIMPSSTSNVKTRNIDSGGKITEQMMTDGLNELFKQYFTNNTASITSSTYNQTDYYKYIKIMCLQIIKFSGDSSHIVYSHLLQNAWNDIVLSNAYLKYVSPNYTTNSSTSYTKLETAILTDERMVPIRCFMENTSFYVENFNQFKLCSGMSDDYIHYISDYSKKIDALIQNYTLYLDGTKEPSNMVNSVYYECYSKLKKYLDSKVIYEQKNKSIWSVFDSTVPITELKKKYNEYSDDLKQPIMLHKVIGMTTYIKYITYLQNLCMIDLYLNNLTLTDLFKNYFSNLIDPNINSNILYNSDIDILKQIFDIYFMKSPIAESSNAKLNHLILFEVTKFIYKDGTTINNTNLLTSFIEKCKESIQTKMKDCDFYDNFQYVFGFMYSEVNIYSTPSARSGGRKTIRQSKRFIDINVPYWYSLFPYINYTFSENGGNDLKRIIMRTTLHNTGVYETLSNKLIVVCTLLFRYFTEKDAIDVTTINTKSSEYNELLNTYYSIIECKKKLIELISEIKNKYKDMTKKNPVFDKKGITQSIKDIKRLKSLYENLINTINAINSILPPPAYDISALNNTLNNLNKIQKTSYTLPDPVITEIYNKTYLRNFKTDIGVIYDDDITDFDILSKPGNKSLNPDEIIDKRIDSKLIDFTLAELAKIISKNEEVKTEMNSIFVNSNKGVIQRGGASYEEHEEPEEEDEEEDEEEYEEEEEEDEDEEEDEEAIKLDEEQTNNFYLNLYKNISNLFSPYLFTSDYIKDSTIINTIFETNSDGVIDFNNKLENLVNIYNRNSFSIDFNTFVEITLSPYNKYYWMNNEEYEYWNSCLDLYLMYFKDETISIQNCLPNNYITKNDNQIYTISTLYIIIIQKLNSHNFSNYKIKKTHGDYEIEHFEDEPSEEIAEIIDFIKNNFIGIDILTAKYINYIYNIFKSFFHLNITKNNRLLLLYNIYTLLFKYNNPNDICYEFLERIEKIQNELTKKSD
jgi:hypothetical protein